MVCCRTGDIVTVDHLLSTHVHTQCNINFQNQRGLTALMEATIAGQTDIVKLLISKGADLTVEDEDGRDALNLACEKGQWDIVQLLNKPNDVTLLTKTVRPSSLTIDANLVDDDTGAIIMLADMMDPTTDWNYIMQHAEMKGESVVLYMKNRLYSDTSGVGSPSAISPVSYVASPSNLSSVGPTATHAAALSLQLNSYDSHGRTFLMHAALYGKLIHVQALLEEGEVDITLKSKNPKEVNCRINHSTLLCITVILTYAPSSNISLLAVLCFLLCVGLCVLVYLHAYGT